MKFKLTKNVKIVSLIGILFILIGYGSYKLYFEKLFIFQENEKKFLASVQNYFVINKTFLPKDDNYKTVTLQDMYDNALIDAVHVPKSSKFCSEDNSFVRAINEDGIIRYVVYLECGKFKSKVDHTSPVIVLNGDKKIIVDLYDSYTDEGLKTVVDDYDGVIDNSKVEVYNKVDTSKPGNYEVVYKIYDKNFNVTREVRDVVVADNLNNIVKRDTNNENYYKGKVDNNYLLFSGMLFRLVKINDDGTVKIVSDDNISHSSYTGDNYLDSNVRHWLNNYYLNHINENSKKYIAEGTWCTDHIPDINNFTCNNKVKDMVGLLDVNEFFKSYDNNVSYLEGNLNKSMLLNKKDSDHYYLSDNRLDGLTYSIVGSIYPSVRPALNIKENTYVISGNGTIEKPYMLGDYSQGSENDYLNQRVIGEYVKYSGYITRISDITDSGNIQLTFMEELEVKKLNGAKEKVKIDLTGIDNYKFNLTQEKNTGYLLNNEYINYLLSDYLVEDEFLIPTTVKNLKYDEYETTLLTGRIFLPYSYQMFSSDSNRIVKPLDGYLYSDISSIQDKIFYVNPYNQLCFETLNKTFGNYSLRPVVFITKNAKISSGDGTYNKPYIMK